MTSPIIRLEAKHKSFPKSLKEIPGAPHTLYYKGELPKESEILIAVVGTRKATPDGLLAAKRLGKSLAEKGMITVSGLALGIDAAAHEGALRGGGKTIAVVANGLDIIYPRQHERLAKEILESHGAIISEYPEGTEPLPFRFLERNRIVSGLSLAIVVIEAPLQSGALVTAKHALDAGREVFVFPGPAHHPNYRGSHMLIRNGARLVTGIENILDDLNIEIEKPEKETEFQNEEELKIFKTIKARGGATDVDNIIETTKLQPHIVKQHLTMLTLQGMIEERSGKFLIKK